MDLIRRGSFGVRSTESTTSLQWYVLPKSWCNIIFVVKETVRVKGIVRNKSIIVNNELCYG